MKDLNEKLKYVLYCRKSSEAEDKQVLSIDSQKRELREVAATNNLKVVKTLWESKSAYKKDREEFNQMVSMLEVGKADSILVYHISRVARNMTDGGIIIDMLKDGIIKEIRTPTEIYSKDSSKEFFLALEFAMAKKSSDDTSLFVKRDIKAKLKKGEYPCFAPRGYLNVDKDGKIAGKQYMFEKQEALAKLGRKLKRIEKDPLLAPLIQELYEMYATGNYPLDQLRDEFYKLGLTGERSKKKLCKQTIRRILTNPMYYGAIRWKEEVMEPEELPEENRHEPIISRELFNKVQEVLGIKSKPNKHNHFYPYSNFIKCDDCGGNITGITAKGRYRYYRCTNCTNKPYVSEKELEKQLNTVMQELTLDDDFLQLALEELNKKNENEIGKRDKFLKQQQITLKRCQSKMDNLVRLKISPDNSEGDLLSDQEFIERKKEILDEKMKIKEKMGDKDQATQNWFDLSVNYVNFFHKLSEKFKTAKPEQKKEMFQFVCYNPTLNSKKLINNDHFQHKYVKRYNHHKSYIITKQFTLDKTKTGSLEPVLNLGRERRDLNPRPSA